MPKDLAENKLWEDFNLKGKKNVDKIINIIQKRSKLIAEHIYKHWVSDFYNNL